MDKQQLLETAKLIKTVRNATATEYLTKAEQITNRMNTLMLERADLMNLIGENNTDMMKDNHANHVRFIGSILKNYNPEVFVDTVLWVFRAYRSRGFTTNYWAALLNTSINALKEIISPENYNEIFLYYQWLQVNIPTFVALSDEQLNHSNSLN